METPTPTPCQDPDVRDALVRLVPRLRLRAVRLCGERALAEDLVQDTLVRLLARHAGGHPPPRDLGRFAFVSLRNAWRDRLRRTGSAQAVSDELRAFGAVEPCPPERQLAARSACRRVAAAVGRLPAEERALLIAALAEPGGQTALARRLGLRRGTLASRLARARRDLRRDLGLAPGEKASVLLVRPDHG